MSIGTFGAVTFEVSAEKTRTFNDFSRKTSAKFEQHNIIGLKPKLEFVAPGLDEVSFQVIFSAFHGLNPLNEANQLREMVLKGEYNPLVIGGKMLGNFVIENISEAWKYVDNKGNVLHIAIDVSLKEYHLDVSVKQSAIQDVEIEKVVAEVEIQARETGLSAQNIADMATIVINSVRDPALAMTGMMSILTATQNLQDGNMLSAVTSSYIGLGLDAFNLIARSKSDPMETAINVLTQIAENDTVDKLTVVRNIYGAKSAGTVLLVAQQLKGVV